MKIKINLEKRGHNSKPSKEAGIISEQVRQEAGQVELTPQELAEKIKRGFTFTPGVIGGNIDTWKPRNAEGTRKALPNPKTGAAFCVSDFWEQQQIIAVDIDNETNHAPNKYELTPNAALAACKAAGIDPYLVYKTFSYKPEHEKFRVLIILDAPITDFKKARDLIGRFANLFNQAIAEKYQAAGIPAEACADSSIEPVKLIFGGRNDSIIYQTENITATSIIEALPQRPADAPRSAGNEKRQNNPPEYKNAAEAQNERDLLISALFAIDPARLDYKEWFKVLGAAKYAGLDYDTFDKWSAQDTGTNDKGQPRYNEQANYKAWQGAADPGQGRGGTGTAKPGTIYYYAQQSGWKFPEKTKYNYDAKMEQSIKKEIEDFEQWIAQAQGGSELPADFFGDSEEKTAAADPAPADAYAPENMTPPAQIQGKPESTEAINANRSLYDLLSNPQGAPVYIYDDAEINEKLGAKYAYSAEMVNTALNAPGNNFALPITGTPNPVIFLTKKSSGNLQRISNILKNARVPVFFQDANRAFKLIKTDNPAEIQNELAKQYRANFSAGGTIADFKNVINSNANTPAIKTGFSILDKTLDGGLYEGLYAIGAISSLGKTTFCLNIAEQIAKGGQDVIIIALEMSKYSLIGRSISRLTFCRYRNNPYDIDNPEGIKYEYCKTSRGITDGSRYKNYNDAEKAIIENAIDYYAQNIGPHLYIYEAIGDMTAEKIRNIVTRHMSFTGTRPVIIIDYLQLIQHEDPHVNGNDKIRTDFNLLHLKQLSRDYKLPIIAISSFNRASYNTEVKMECFKESGGIDYTCDVIIGLQLAGVGMHDFDATEAKAKNPREIELVFLKNREAPVGEMIKYFYYPMFNHFEESSEDIRAEREYKNEAAQKKKEAEKANKAEAAKLERSQMVNDAFNACCKNGEAFITEMVDFLGGKPAEKTLTRYIKETENYTVLGNRVIKNKL